MVDVAGWEFESLSDRLFIHFGVDGHYLKLDTFMATADSARRIIEAFDETFFRGDLIYNLLVLPPEPGTFLSKLEVRVFGGLAALFTFINSDVGIKYVEGLTGKPPTHWAEQAGVKTSEAIQRASELFHEEKEEDRGSEMDLDESDKEAACQVGSQIVVAMTRGVLEKSGDELHKVGMELGELADAMEARADFYHACVEDQDVKKIGFTADHDFPIPRAAFPERTVKPHRDDRKDEPIPWAASVESIYITSPNWDKDDQKSRQWKGKDQAGRDCYFVVEDAEFWDLVRRKDLRVEVLDDLKVQGLARLLAGKAALRQERPLTEWQASCFRS